MNKHYQIAFQRTGVFLIIGILVLCGRHSVHAQKHPEIVFEEVLGKLDQIDGWTLDENLNPIFQKNAIPFPEIAARSTKREERLGQENIQEITLANLIIDSVEYYAWVIRRNTGKYRFPNIQEKWIRQTITEYAVFHPSRFDGIKRAVDSLNSSDYDTTHVINFQPLVSGACVDCFEGELMQKIVTGVRQENLVKLRYPDKVYLGYEILNSKDADPQVHFMFKRGHHKGRFDSKSLGRTYYSTSFQEFAEVLGPPPAAVDPPKPEYVDYRKRLLNKQKVIDN